MATKFNYSNNMTGVNAKIAEVTTEEFRKKYVFVTNSGIYYVYGDKRYKTENEARNALIKMGYNNGDIKIVQQWGGYNYITECAIVEGDNSEWVDIIFFQTNAKTKNLGLFELSEWGARVIRIYNDFKFKSYYKTENDWYIDNANGRLYYNRDGILISGADSDYGLMKKEKIFDYLPLSVNDLSSDSQKSVQNYNNYKRELSQQSKDIILRVFEKCTEDKIETYTDMREFFRRPGAGSCCKASETKKKLIDEQFVPILEKIEMPELELNELELAEAKRRGFDFPESYYGYSNKCYSSCFHRFGDWIVFSGSSEQRVFYNVKTQKRYSVNYYKNSMWRREQCNIGIFRSYDLINSLSQYGNTIGSRSVTFYLNGKYCYGPEASGKTMCVRYKDCEYKFAPKCYNENNEEISPMECFANTIVTDFLKSEENWEYKVKFFNVNTRNNDIFIENKTFKDLVNMNRCPGIAFLLLCVKNDRRVMAEQLYKLGLNGMLVQLLINPDSFKEKSESDDDISYWRRSYVFCNYDKKGTNLKKMFSISMDKIKTYDEMLWAEYQKDLDDKTKVPSISMIQNLIGDAFINLDSKTFVGYLNYGKRYSLDSYIINELKPHIIDGKSPKETLMILNRIGDMHRFKDYLTLRTQYINYFDAEHAEEIKRIYKIFPGKAKKFRYLREKTNPYYYNQNRLITVGEQYNNYLAAYKICKPVYGNDGDLIGVYLELTEQEHIRLLHDELSEFITQHKKELQAEGFKNAAQRLLKYEYTGKDLSIVAPRESTELAIEGGTLSHCVAGFIDPVIRGTENVLFIRRNDMLNTPYYTMAISNDGRIEQIHCYRNGHLSVAEQLEAYNKSGLPSYNKCFDIIGFLHEWAKKKKGLVKESTIRESYGALGAH